MVANTHAMIGYGCKAYKNWFAEAPLSKKQAGGVNLEGAVQKTRFLHFVMQKKHYGENGQHLDKMFDALAIDLAKLQTQGIKVNGERWHLVVIAAVGDWQFFAKVGHLNRCYTHVSKRSGQKTLNGICHLCMAGHHSWPTWEDFVDSPTWRPTCGTLEPLEQTPSLIRRLHVNVANRASFFQPDFWHCLHLGAGKNLVASANIGERFSFIDDAAQAWLRSRNDKLYSKCISAVTMGIDGLQKVPTAGWQKASDTTLLLEFLEHFCSMNAGLANADPILRWTWVAASNINLSVRMLYRGGLWLDQSTAHTVARCGMNFLKSYQHLVALTLAADRDRAERAEELDPGMPLSEFCNAIWRPMQNPPLVGQHRRDGYVLDTLCNESKHKAIKKIVEMSASRLQDFETFVLVRLAQLHLHEAHLLRPDYWEFTLNKTQTTLTCAWLTLRIAEPIVRADCAGLIVSMVSERASAAVEVQVFRKSAELAVGIVEWSNTNTVHTWSLTDRSWHRPKAWRTHNNSLLTLW
ncbi:unnamed protein product [Symbiodinium sp. CCMP2592]|nr:unnamed protein product [Symbiodinium sp. CCMP2592]